MSRCLYNSSFTEFINTKENSIFGTLCEKYHGEALTTTREAWRSEISIMKEILFEFSNRDGKIIFEYDIPRLGKSDTTTTLTFKVVPESSPPTNIHVIIGRNNVGKTYFIKNFIKAVYRPEDREEVGTLRSSNNETGRLVSSRQQAFANILCVSFSPFDDYSDIREMTAKRKVMPFTYIGLTSDNIHETLKNDFVKSLNNCQKSERKLALLDQALNILETDPIFEKSNLKALLSASNEDVKDIADAENTFKRLSSGHQVIMLALIQLIDRITERSLVILDEPENHLHPPLLAAFIRALKG